MEKKMSLFDLVSIGVGSVIGAGIFSMLGTGIALTGRSIVFALVLSMLLTAMQNVRSICMSTLFALNGGAYAQSALVLPPILRGVNSVSYLTGSLTFSVYGISIASYLVQLVPAWEPYQKLIAVVVMLLFFFVTARGTGAIAKVQNLMTVCMYAALILLMVFGITKVKVGGFEGEPFFYNGSGGFMQAVAIMAFTCQGASMVVNCTNRAKNPVRDIPLSYVISTLVCMALYCVLGFVGSSILPYEQCANASMGVIAKQVMPHYLYIFFVIGGAMFALGTSLLGGLSTMAAPMIDAAEDGWFPQFMKSENVILVMICVVSLLPIVSNFSLDIIVSYIQVPNMVLGFLTNFLAMNLPTKYREQWENSPMKKMSPATFKVIILLSCLANAVTAYFSLTGLTPALIAGNIGMTACLFIWAWYRMKKGYVVERDKIGVQSSAGE